MSPGQAALSVCAVMGLAVSATARADEAIEFYKAKALTVIVGSPAGTAYDLYARTIARHLPRQLPGAPPPVVQNMPGAGSLVAANYIANVAAKDGSVIGAINSAVPFQQLFGITSVRFDARRTNWLPSPTGFAAVLLVSADAPAQTLAQLREREVLMATLSPGATPSFYAAVFNHVLGTKLKPITGHPSMPAALLAMQRGEVHGFPSTPWSSLIRSYADLYTSRRITILLQYGPARIPELKDVPFVRDLATSDEDRQLIDVAMAPLVLGFPYMLAEGVPADRVGAMRRLMLAVMKDSEFLAEAKRQMLDIEPVTGEAAQRLVEAAYAAPAPVIERIRRIHDSQSR